jgi:aminocarboxymuconate-semialdehyde decarboxylase
MDRMGIDVQALSPVTEQYYYWTEPDIGRQIAREVNDGIAEIVAQQPDRFVGFGTLPLQNPDFAVEELERIVKTMGFKGVEIGTNVDGVSVGDKKLGLDKVFAKLEELDVLAFMHPRPFNGGARFSEYHMSNIIGQPLDSTTAVTQMIFEGVFERYPEFKLCVAHAGGYLPFYTGRMDHAYAVRPECAEALPKKPSAYLHQIYFDGMTFDAGMMRYLIDRYGADRILLGTDYPYDMGIDDPVRQLDGFAPLSEAERIAIKGGNAARLLKLEARAEA